MLDDVSPVKSTHSVDEITRDMEEKAVARRAKSNEWHYFNLRGFPLNPETVGILTREEAEKAKAIIFNEQKRVLQIGTTDPERPEYLKLLEKLKEQKYASKTYLISASSLQEALRVYDRHLRPRHRQGRG